MQVLYALFSPELIFSELDNCYCEDMGYSMGIVTSICHPLPQAKRLFNMLRETQLFSPELFGANVITVGLNSDRADFKPKLNIAIKVALIQFLDYLPKRNPSFWGFICGLCAFLSSIFHV